MSPVTIFGELELKATYLASGLIEGFAPPAGLPSDATVTRMVFGEHPLAPMHVSRRNTHEPRGPAHTVVFGSRFVACESKTTYLPSALMAESRLCPFTGLPSVVTVIRKVLGVQPDAAPMHVSRS